jgi:hypothetical protein
MSEQMGGKGGKKESLTPEQKAEQDASLQFKRVLTWGLDRKADAVAAELATHMANHEFATVMNLNHIPASVMEVLARGITQSWKTSVVKESGFDKEAKEEAEKQGLYKDVTSTEPKNTQEVMGKVNKLADTLAGKYGLAVAPELWEEGGVLHEAVTAPDVVQYMKKEDMQLKTVNGMAAFMLMEASGQPIECMPTSIKEERAMYMPMKLLQAFYTMRSELTGQQHDYNPQWLQQLDEAVELGLCPYDSAEMQKSIATMAQRLVETYQVGLDDIEMLQLKKFIAEELEGSGEDVFVRGGNEYTAQLASLNAEIEKVSAAPDRARESLERADAEYKKSFKSKALNWLSSKHRVLHQLFSGHQSPVVKQYAESLSGLERKRDERILELRLERGKLGLQKINAQFNRLGIPENDPRREAELGDIPVLIAELEPRFSHEEVTLMAATPYEDFSTEDVLVLLEENVQLLQETLEARIATIDSADEATAGDITYKHVEGLEIARAGLDGLPKKELKEKIAALIAMAMARIPKQPAVEKDTNNKQKGGKKKGN